MNQIDDVCRDVEKTINQTIQNTLNQLERDCDDIGALVDSAIDGDNAARAYNMRASGKGLLLLFLGCTLPIALAINFLSSSFSDQGGNSIDFEISGQNWGQFSGRVLSLLNQES